MLGPITMLTTALLVLGLSAQVPAEAETKTVEANGVRLSYVEEGSGDPVVLVPPAIADLRIWDPVREALAEKYRVIVYSQRYFGGEPWPDEGEAFGVETHAADLIAFLQALNLPPAHLVGWSYSGAVVAYAALRDPARIRSITVYEGGFGSLTSEMPRSAEAMATQAAAFAPAVESVRAGDTEKAARLLVELVFQLPPGRFDNEDRTLKKMWIENARTLEPMFAAQAPMPVTCDQLKDFSVPTLVLSGDKTTVFWAVQAEAMAQCIPDSQHVIMPGLNHGGPVRDPDQFAATVSEFLSRH